MLFLAPWSLVLLAAFRLKQRILEAPGGGYDVLAELTGVGDALSLTLLDQVALYTQDILLIGILGSLLYLGLLRALPARWRPAVAGLVCGMLFLLLYAQLKAFWEVGTFVSGRLMLEGLIGPGRELISEYATSSTVLKLWVSLAAVASMAWALHLVRRSIPTILTRSLRRGADGLAVVSGVVVLGAAFRQTPETPYDRSAGLAAVMAFLGSNEYERGGEQAVEGTPAQLVAEYAALASAPVPNTPSPYFGAARGYDVVVWLFESLPDVCYRMPESEAAMPNLHALQRASFVAQAHYATYPYSRRAYSSIYTSWYPLNGIRGAVERFGRISRDLEAPGMVRAAAEQGYETVAFVPERPVTMSEDILRYASVGFQEHVVPTSAFSRPEDGTRAETDRDWVRRRDREGFRLLSERTLTAIESGQRYLYAFNPQASHGPWPGIGPASSSAETCRAGLQLFGEVDAMLGEYVDLLRRAGRLDRTLIVALGDHGLRTRTEYPPFHGGTLDDVTFHVPFVLYAPGVTDSTTIVPWMTSHVDVAPSVLDLLGISAGRSLELGSPIWEPKLGQRATYFFAKGYLGADGLQRKREAIMVRYLYGAVSRSPWMGTLRFTAADHVPGDDLSAKRAIDELDRIADIQTALARSMIRSGDGAPAGRVTRGTPGTTPGTPSGDRR